MDESYPRTLLELEDRFRTEEDCRAYLAQLRWPEGFCCPRCRHAQAWRLKQDRFQCRGCDAIVSVTAGTIFHRNHLPLRVWFRAIWWVTNQKSGVSALGLQRTFGLGSYETAWTCLHKLRRAMVRPGREPLTDEVEVDEIYVGGGEASATSGRPRPSSRWPPKCAGEGLGVSASNSSPTYAITRTFRLKVLIGPAPRRGAYSLTRDHDYSIKSE